MKLIEAVRDLESFDEENTIYAAKPWTESSVALIAKEPASGGLPEDVRKIGLKYFLEVFIAREFLEDWLNNLQKIPTLQEKCARLIHYANDDA